MYSQRNKTNQVLLSAFQHLKGAYKEAGEGLLARACRDKASGKGFTLKELRFISNVGKTLYCEGGGTLEQAPGEVVDVLFLVTLRVKSDRALSNLI